MLTNSRYTIFSRDALRAETSFTEFSHLDDSTASEMSVNQQDDTMPKSVDFDSVEDEDIRRHAEQQRRMHCSPLPPAGTGDSSSDEDEQEASKYTEEGAVHDPSPVLDEEEEVSMSSKEPSPAEQVDEQPTGVSIVQPGQSNPEPEQFSTPDTSLDQRDGSLERSPAKEQSLEEVSWRGNWEEEGSEQLSRQVC